MQIIQNKYKPSHISNIVGNTKQIQYITNWLKNYDSTTELLKQHNLLRKVTKGRKKKIIGISAKDEKNVTKKGNLVVTGAHGTGKTTIIKLILEYLKYDIIDINILNNNIIFDDILLKKLSIINEQQKINNGKMMVIIIDEFESIITANEKSSIIQMIRDNNFCRWLPIIIIGNNQHNKQLNDIKKYADEVKIYSPFSNELLKWVYVICKNEQINLEYNAIPKFIEYCQNDIRRILIQLDELLINYGHNKKITIFQLENFDNTMKMKDQEFDLYKCTEKLLTEYKDIESCINIYDMEKTLIPLMIHENYYKYLTKNRYNIIDNLSKSDIIENYIKNEQNWDLINVQGILSCAYPSYLINKYGTQQHNHKLNFAADLHRTSVKMMNKKNILKKNDVNNKKNCITHIKTMSEYIYINDI